MAGLATSLHSQLKARSIHTTATLRKFAAAMRVTHQTLFELAGYFGADDQEPQEIDIEDPEIRLFFRNYDWNEFAEQEKDVVRQRIRVVEATKIARGAGGPRRPEGASGPTQQETPVEDDDR